LERATISSRRSIGSFHGVGLFGTYPRFFLEGAMAFPGDVSKVDVEID
jgi:hypothetical protein